MTSRQMPLDGVSKPSVSFDFTNSTALVTGATSNLGLAFARALVGAGANVGVLGGRNRSALEAVVTELRAGGTVVAGELADLADSSAVDAALSRLTAALPPIDVLVSNAGIRSAVAPQDLDMADWDRTIAVNLRSPFQLAARLMPSMMERGFGRVITISGLNVLWGAAATTHVGASKAGLAGLTTGLAAQGARRGVTVNSIMPGFIGAAGGSPSEREATVRNLVPLGREAQQEEIVQVGLFLASGAASYITGQTLLVTGGASPLVHLG